MKMKKYTCYITFLVNHNPLTQTSYLCGSSPNKLPLHIASLHIFILKIKPYNIQFIKEYSVKNEDSSDHCNFVKPSSHSKSRYAEIF